MRVLIVDDTDSVLGVLRGHFESRGHAVTTSSSVDQAVLKLMVAKDRFDAIVSDRNLGDGLTGLDLYRTIKSGCYAKRFILFTSDTDDLPRGCPPIVEKPHFEKLITVVEGLKPNG